MRAGKPPPKSTTQCTGIGDAKVYPFSQLRRLFYVEPIADVDWSQRVRSITGIEHS